MLKVPTTMKAMVLRKYDQLELAELPVPIPKANEVLCRIRSVAICGSDPKMIHGYYASVNWPPYFPFVMGHEWAGEIVAVGPGVKQFQVGDRVAGEAHKGCGICDNCKKGHYTVCLNYGKDGRDGSTDTGHRHYGFNWQGANAEYNVYHISAIHAIPDNVSFDVAAMCDTAGVAMHGIELSGITPGGTTVVIGPGPIGLCAMQIARGMGAGKVIMIGRGSKLAFAGQLGADVLIDFEKEDVVTRVLQETNGIGADEVIECSGANDSPMKACHMARKTGHVVLTANYREDLPSFQLPLNTIVFNELMIYGSKANPNVSEIVLDYFSRGVINGDALVTHRFPLEEYAQAVELFEHKRDHVIKAVINP